MPDPIVIVDYNPEWPAVFDWLRDRADGALRGLTYTIEHIGSTAVPGLAAKPVIDLVVIVSPADVLEGTARLVSIGYEHQGSSGVAGRDAFKGLPDDPPHHLYLSPTDSEELRAQLTFRDRLRTDTDLAARYAILKRSLAVRFRQPHGLHRCKDEVCRRRKQTCPLFGLSSRLHVRQRPPTNS